MLIHRYASLPHYADHIEPIWQALPVEVRGHSWAPRSTCWWGEPITGRALDAAGPVLVAGLADARRMSPRRLLYVEHGAGQSYPGCATLATHGSYSGGRGLDRVDLFIVPSQTVSQRWVHRYGAPTAVVGCPKMDPWHSFATAGSGRRDRSGLDAGIRYPGGVAGSAPTTNGTGPATVAFTFHWDYARCPETRSALPHYAAEIPKVVHALRESGVHVIGHGHPRAWGALERFWRGLNVERTSSLAHVFDRADVLVADNTSALYEFASLERPVVVLNAPWYRRDVEHGLRFWEHVPGVQVDQPAELLNAIRGATYGGQSYVERRRAAVAFAYAATDGHAAQRAADAIMEVVYG